jgi:uncharacterized protein YciW
MPPFDASHTRWMTSRRAPVDDAYSEWFNANSRCTMALRTWRAADSHSREAAYRSYLAELDQEEAAAHELERRSGLCLAA